MPRSLSSLVNFGRRPVLTRLPVEAAVVVAAGGEVEGEQVLHGDDLALHADHLGDRGDAARAVLEAGLLHDEVEGAGDLLADGAHGQVDAGHQHHGLEAGQGVARGVGVHGRDRPVVAGVHGLEHVERGTVADLTDDDPVGPHTQRVLDQVADVDLAATLDVRRAGLQAQHVLLVQLELGGVLDGDDALVGGDERRDDVERGRLAGAGTAGDDDVAAAEHAGPQEVAHGRREGAEGDQVGVGERVLGELADGEHRAVERDGRDDGVDAGAVGQAGVDQRAGLVDATADPADDLVDDAPQVRLAGELGRRRGRACRPARRRSSRGR